MYDGAMIEEVSEFQSTHPQGVRLYNFVWQVALYSVSIHAPAGGATFSVKIKLNYTIVSIHAPAGGATI
mgnify:CR=1 FL=1